MAKSDVTSLRLTPAEKARARALGRGAIGKGISWALAVAPDPDTVIIDRLQNSAMARERERNRDIGRLVARIVGVTGDADDAERWVQICATIHGTPPWAKVVEAVGHLEYVTDLSEQQKRQFPPMTISPGEYLLARLEATL